ANGCAGNILLKIGGCSARSAARDQADDRATHETAAHVLRRRDHGWLTTLLQLLVRRAKRRGADDFRRIDVRQIVTAEIRNRQLTEDVVEDRGGVLNRLVALHDAGRLEAREGESLHVLLERHAVLKPEAHRDGEVVHQRPEGSALLVHVDEDFAQAAILVFTRAQINLVPAHSGLLRVTLAARGQLL